jgi:hypothetical protein
MGSADALAQAAPSHHCRKPGQAVPVQAEVQIPAATVSVLSAWLRTLLTTVTWPPCHHAPTVGGVTLYVQLFGLGAAGW